MTDIIDNNSDECSADKEQDCWRRFTITGSIEDYLSYTACTGESHVAGTGGSNDRGDKIIGNSSGIYADRRL